MWEWDEMLGNGVRILGLGTGRRLLGAGRFFHRKIKESEGFCMKEFVSVIECGFAAMGGYLGWKGFGDNYAGYKICQGKS